MNESQRNIREALTFLISGGTLDGLSQNSLQWVASISGEPNILADVYEHAKSFEVFNALAENAKTPFDTLVSISVLDEGFMIRLASNTGSSQDLLRNIAKKGKSQLSLLVVANPSCPLDVFTECLNSPDLAVREAAWKAMKHRKDFDYIDIPESWIKNLAV